MNAITTDNTVDKYFATLVDLTPDVKVGLIKKLEDSLQTTIKPDEVKEEKMILGKDMQAHGKTTVKLPKKLSQTLEHQGTLIVKI